MMKLKIRQHFKDHPLVLNLLVLLGTIFFLFMVAEWVLRINGKYATFNEKFGHPYHSLFDAGDKSWYHIFPPHQIASQDLKEYSYSIMANNEGLLDKDFTVAKKPGTVRIMIIGDSFVQGMGAGVDSTCPKMLEGILRKHYSESQGIEVWNCGVGNSDPLFEYILFKNILLKYNPDYVIEVINSTDITDVILRGGNERFKSDTTVTYSNGPWFEPMYARSFVVRTIVHDVLGYNWYFKRLKDDTEAIAKSEWQIDSTIYNFHALCSTHNIKYLAAFHPRNYEMNDTMKYGMTDLVRFCDSMYIPCIDVRPCLYAKGFIGSKAKELFWPKDGHFNDLGYSTFSECLSIPVIVYLDSMGRKKTNL